MTTMEKSFMIKVIPKVENRSVIIVTHDHSLKDIADRILWLEDGMLSDETDQ
jgi:ABC-type lipoprotein export system ATPase subunit